MRYRAEIDGLRAIAVLPVILFHAAVPGFWGGYVGVDVFFVISGYLITAILLDDLASGRFSIVRFYERRARRILPALFFVLTCTVPFAWFWLHPGQLQDYARTVAAVVLFASNIFFWRSTDYFAPAAETNPLLHTWSLAVEEQFYIGFPLLLWILWRAGRRFPAPLITVLILASLLLAEWMSRRYPGANFYLLPTRAWELLAGALCAWILRGGTPAAIQVIGDRGAAALSWAGLGCILGSILLLSDETPFPSLFALPAVGGAVLFILVGNAAFGAGRLLAWRPMVGVGLISYSAYLWHQPVFAFVRLRSPEALSIWVMLALALGSLALAALTWRFVEQPFRHGRRQLLPTRYRLFTASAAAILVACSLSALTLAAGGWPGRTAPSGKSFAALNLEERLAPSRSVNPGCSATLPLPAACYVGGTPRMLLWGDSFAMHLAPALAAGQPPEAGFIQAAMPVCAPVLGLAVTNRAYPPSWSRGCIAFNDGVLEILDANPGIDVVVMASPLGIVDYAFALRDGSIVSTDLMARLIAAMATTAAEIRRRGATPVFVAPPPMTGEDLSTCAVQALVFQDTAAGPPDCSFPDSSRSAANRVAYSIANRLAEIMPVVRLDEILCSEGRCNTLIDGRVMFRDTGHFTREGSELLGRRGLYSQILMAAGLPEQ